MTHFLARMAHEGATLEIPAQLTQGDAEILLRGHRYGQPGLTHILAGGIRIGTLVFREDSYPWEVYPLRIPHVIARRPMRIEFLGVDLEEEVDLPPGAVLGLERVEVRPLDPAATFQPTIRQWFLASLLPAFVFVSLVWARWGRLVAGIGFTVASALVVIAHAFAPAPSVAATEHLWVIVPTCMAFWLVIRFALRVEPVRARRLAVAGSLVVLVHAIIIFFPSHSPPCPCGNSA
jgi:hypothetical protein